MCTAGSVYGVATDDMDALTFGTPKLIRHLMAPGNNQKLTIDEFDMATVLEGMGLTQVRCTSAAVVDCWLELCGALTSPALPEGRDLECTPKHEGECMDRIS